MRIERTAYEVALGRSGLTAMEARKKAKENAGITESSYTRAIRGDKVRPATVGAIASVLNVDIADLIQDEKGVTE